MPAVGAPEPVTTDVPTPAFGSCRYSSENTGTSHARAIRAAHPGWSQTQANSAAWQQGKRLLEEAIAKRLDRLSRQAERMERDQNIAIETLARTALNFPWTRGV